MNFFSFIFHTQKKRTSKDYFQSKGSKCKTKKNRPLISRKHQLNCIQSIDRTFLFFCTQINHNIDVYAKMMGQLIEVEIGHRAVYSIKFCVQERCFRFEFSEEIYWLQGNVPSIAINLVRRERGCIVREQCLFEYPNSTESIIKILQSIIPPVFVYFNLFKSLNL